MPESRANHLLLRDYVVLSEACRSLHESFPGNGPYLVGSCTQRPDYRDVDVRLVLFDNDYDDLFLGRPAAFWSMLCLAISTHLGAVTGLPVDFQIQRMTEANAAYGEHYRSALGLAGVRYAAGGMTPPGGSTPDQGVPSLEPTEEVA